MAVAASLVDAIEVVGVLLVDTAKVIVALSLASVKVVGVTAVISLVGTIEAVGVISLVDVTEVVVAVSLVKFTIAEKTAVTSLADIPYSGKISRAKIFEVALPQNILRITFQGSTRLSLHLYPIIRFLRIIFEVVAKSTKTAKIVVLENFPLYGIATIEAVGVVSLVDAIEVASS